MSAPREATAREIAEALGVSNRSTQYRALREGWPHREAPCAGRPKRLYPVGSLPADVRAALGADDLPVAPFNAPSTAVEAVPETPPGDPLEYRWERLTGERRRCAEAKLALVDRAVALASAEGIRMPAACDRVAAEFDGAPAGRTLLSAWRAVRGLPYDRRAMALADRHRGCVVRAECHPAAWEAFKADYLRPEAPALAACHRRLLRIADGQGWAVPASPRPLLRRLEAEVAREVILLARRGEGALDRTVPPQERLRPEYALDAVNCDGFRFDNFVDWHGGGRDPIRPVGVFWQDLASGRPLSWRVAETENADSYQLSFHDLLRKYGIPRAIYADNGRGVAAKHLTGGIRHRFRGKHIPGDPVGLMTQLVGPDGIHWTTPYSGQSKPIERAFRDLAGEFAQSPGLRGSWTGGNPSAKPENYRSRAVPREAFLTELDAYMADYCARRGRKGIDMEGRSFDEKFASVWDPDRVRRPAEGHLARWLLAAEGVTADSRSGAVRILGTTYWDPAMARELADRPQAERKVVVRYDPDNLALPVTVERPDGSLVARAKPRGPVAFGSAEAARERGREKRRLRRATREALAVQRRIDAQELELLLAEAPVPEPPALPPARPAAEPAVAVSRAEDDELDELNRAGDELILRAIGMGGAE